MGSSAVPLMVPLRDSDSCTVPTRSEHSNLTLKAYVSI